MEEYNPSHEVEIPPPPPQYDEEDKDSEGEGLSQDDDSDYDEGESDDDDDYHAREAPRAKPPRLSRPVASMVSPPEVIEFENVVKGAEAVSEEDARASLQAYISNTCCWGSGSAEKAAISTEVWCSFVVKIQTFIQYRTTERKHEPYKRGYQYTRRSDGQKPKPWDMDVPQTVKHFEDRTFTHEVPFTTVIKKCFQCKGKGRVRCDRCRGKGKTDCSWCHGSGKGQRDSDGDRKDCRYCRGNGKERCDHKDCKGSGRIRCEECDGKKKLRFFEVMHQIFETLTNTKVVDNIPDDELPPALLVSAPGKELLNHQSINIKPPQGFSPDVDIALVEVDKIANDQVDRKLGLQLQERLTITSIPTSKATAKDGESEYHFWVYGSDNRCHINPEWGYPQQVCCGCSIS